MPDGIKSLGQVKEANASKRSVIPIFFFFFFFFLLCSHSQLENNKERQ